MKKKNQMEELQNRRDFFKKAAKGALPILGALLLAGSPVVNSIGKTPMGCELSCSGGCYGGCSVGCGGTCKGTCVGGCLGSCGYSSKY